MVGGDAPVLLLEEEEAAVMVEGENDDVPHARAMTHFIHECHVTGRSFSRRPRRVPSTSSSRRLASPTLMQHNLIADALNDLPQVSLPLVPCLYYHIPSCHLLKRHSMAGFRLQFAMVYSPIARGAMQIVVPWHVVACCKVMSITIELFIPCHLLGGNDC